jgi:DNA-binding CsgD family transcriptional regulator
MTRLLYLPDDATIIQVEVSIPAKQLSTSINSGSIPIPLLLESADRLAATQIGQTVIVSPRRKRGRPAKPNVQNSLTRRQHQVLELAAQGYANSQIATLMGISRRTVSYHLKSIKTQISVTPQSLIAEHSNLLNLDQKME